MNIGYRGFVDVAVGEQSQVELHRNYCECNSKLWK